ncbi:sigma-54 dependent transcriptional regulator [Undibacterium cyanobacteriorum]|uniref:Sigma-54 dependent transcriptional regulator n=1 Tax=Undibacterium cyanobacteriorum TaxID=3073561 RepID=A0ABY9RPF9_9BURK|nr:sigma-54 dependent transcriptional regulator [Undibacterium sp. 20NA77.5]WMW81881.1 sigma-54 dependent transcriptional regulator [Undibacterium sp. 20NA77.5]
MSLPKILIVDDDESVQISLALLLKQNGFASITCDEPAKALEVLEREPQQICLVLLDMNFSLQTTGEEGLALMAQIHQRLPHLPVLLMTAWGSISLAVKGVKAGASDFFTKPWDNQHLLQLIRTTLASRGEASSETQTRQSLDAQYDFSEIVGEHPELLKILATLGRVAKTNASVLILGESGTGKELVADAIHRNSPRAAQDIVKVNMGAVSSSLFESEMFGHVRGAFTDAKADRKGHFATAHQGSLFLDEIGELNRADQVKLLRVLQSQTYQAVGSSKTEKADVRIISATNRELAEQVAQGEFREDLFYRLNLITLRLPPLRERRSDIPLIAKQLLVKLCQTYGMEPVQLAPSAVDWLSQQAWPGNIRQLKQSLERTLLLVGKASLEKADFLSVEEESGVPQCRETSIFSGMTLDQVEKLMINKALDDHAGNLSRVAKVLGLSRFALYRRLEKHQIVVGEAEADSDSKDAANASTTKASQV